MKTIYYYFYCFYLKVLKDSDPHLLATLALSFCIGMLLNALITIFAVLSYGISLSTWFMFGVVIVSLIANAIILHKSGLAKEIIITRPKFFKNNNVSIVIVILFFLFSISFLFFGPSFEKCYIK